MLADGQQQETTLLASTVQSVLSSAAARGLESVAMPLIGTGLAGWPKQLAAQLCLAEVAKFTKAVTSSLKVCLLDYLAALCWDDLLVQSHIVCLLK